MCAKKYLWTFEVDCHPHISDFGEGLSACAVLDGLYGHRDLHRLPFRDPETLKEYVQNNVINEHYPQTDVQVALSTVKYLVYGSKNTRAKRFDLLQLGRPQDASVNFCAFLTWTKRLEALPQKY